MNAFGKGRIFRSEYKKRRDENTGAVIHQLTDHPSINVHLYFLNSSFTPDQKTVVFTSYRSGKANLFKVGFPTGEITQLTDCDGLHAFSGCISVDGNEVFFTRQGGIFAVDLETLRERPVGFFGQGAQLGECSLNANGAWRSEERRVG